MKRGVALVVSVLALAACGGPLEDEAALAQDEQSLVQVPGSELNGRTVKTPASALDRVRQSPTARSEQRWYAPSH